MPFAELLALATLVIKTFGPIVVRIVEAISSGADPTEALAAESVAEILPAQGHLDAAIAFSRANRAAADLRSAHVNGETAGMTPVQLAYVEHALSTHTLAVVS